MDCTRLSDWESRLSEYLFEFRERFATHEYGADDCCTFCGGAVEAMTGVDPMAEFHGSYDSIKSAKAALKKIGKGSLKKTLDAKFPACPIGKAKRGDLAFCTVADMESVGLIMGNWAWFLAEDDLIRLPISAWEGAWCVG